MILGVGMRVQFSGRAAGAAVFLAATIAFAGPAMAGRGIQADASGTPAIPNAGCTLGTSCTGYDLPVVVNDFGDEFYRSATSGADHVEYFNNRQIFFYKEGVVSFDQELPLTASVAGGLASLGNGDWFAVSFGAATDMFAFEDPNGQFRVNWGPNQGVVLQEGVNCDAFGFCEIDPIIQDAAFQLLIQSYFFSNSETPRVDYRYLDGVTPANVVSGFNYTPYVGGYSGPNPNDTATDYIDLRFGGSRNAGGATAAVPEPGVWALMILGFGLAGAAVRRRRAAGPALG